MTAATTPLLTALTAWPAGPGSSHIARRATANWASDPVLAGRASPGAAAVAVGRPGGDEVLTALAGRAGDDWAATAALAGLAVRLAPIVARWTRAGMPALDVEAAEADLVAGCLAGLRRSFQGDGPVTAEQVVQAGWHQVHNTRRTERARTARHRPLDGAATLAAGVGRSTVEAVLVELSGAVSAGTVTALGAATVAWQAAGWSTADVAARTAMSPVALRARRSRTIFGLGDYRHLGVVA
jgi:hypothetical protein